MKTLPNETRCVAVNVTTGERCSRKKDVEWLCGVHERMRRLQEKKRLASFGRVRP